MMTTLPDRGHPVRFGPQNSARGERTILLLQVTCRAVSGRDARAPDRGHPVRFDL
jgi:hypothetical protein